MLKVKEKDALAITPNQKVPTTASSFWYQQEEPEAKAMNTNEEHGLPARSLNYSTQSISMSQNTILYIYQHNATSIIQLL